MTFNYNSTSACDSAMQAVKPVSQLDHAHDALRQAHELSLMVTNMADLICGSVPTSKGISKEEYASGGVIGDLLSRARETSSAISDATEAVHRINRAFGL